MQASDTQLSKLKSEVIEKEEKLKSMCRTVATSILHNPDIKQENSPNWQIVNEHTRKVALEVIKQRLTKEMTAKMKTWKDKLLNDVQVIITRAKRNDGPFKKDYSNTLEILNGGDGKEPENLATKITSAVSNAASAVAGLFIKK